MHNFLRFIMCALFLGGCVAKYPPLNTVKNVDLDRYSGTWYEIARYENRFETGCVGASATYERDGDKLKVTNRCFDANGTQIGEANGVAKIPNPNEPTKLKVSFFWPFYGDYWIIDLAQDYRYSVIGHPKRTYFWILSRTKTLAQPDIDAIISRMNAWGYDPQKLYWTNNL